jgi:Na+/proline symporter
MSTADSDLNITSTTLVKDIIIPITKVNNEKMLLKIAKIINIVIGSLAIILAINFRHVVDLVIFITGFWCPIIMIPLIFALFGKTIPTKFMLISSSSGAGAFLLWEHYVHELNLTSVFVGTMTSIILFSIFIFVVKMISCRKCK